MPNSIKYSETSQTLALKKGNFFIGTGDVDKGPTSTTGYFNRITPASGGYVIYMNKVGAPGGLSYHSAANDSELVSFTNLIAAENFTTVAQCLNYFVTQTDKICVNRDYEGIVTNGLVLNLDAGFTPSYPRTGTTWYDLGGNSYNGTLTNSPTFNSSDSGSIVFDGVDDYVKSMAVNGTGIMNPALFGDTITVCIWLKSTSTRASQYAITTGAYTGGITGFTLVVNDGGINGTDFIGIASSTKSASYGTDNFISADEWVNICFGTDGTNMYVYKNGTLIKTVPYGGNHNLQPNGAGLQLSGPNNTGGFLFVGNISNVTVYNRALTATEVLQNYNAQKGRFGL